jgi:hypothetical protein
MKKIKFCEYGTRLKSWGVCHCQSFPSCSNICDHGHKAIFKVYLHSSKLDHSSLISGVLQDHIIQHYHGEKARHINHECAYLGPLVFITTIKNIPQGAKLSIFHLYLLPVPSMVSILEAPTLGW